jgi:hypothetical protein
MAQSSIDQYHTLFGLHSNIPACCVDFFVQQWFPVSHTAHRDREHWKQIRQVEKEVGHIDYIPCPSCLQQKNFVPVHKCDISCQEFINDLNKLRGK